MNICFSCRLALEDGVLHMNVNSDVVCARCYMKYLEARGESRLTFEHWRANEGERYGFDPYLERDAQIQMQAGSNAALLPVDRDTLDALEDVRDALPELTNDEILVNALGLFKKKLVEIETDAMRMSNLARMIAAAIRGVE